MWNSGDSKKKKKKKKSVVARDVGEKVIVR